MNPPVVVVIGSQIKNLQDPEFARQFLFDKLDRLVPSGALIVSGVSPGGGPDIWAQEWADSRIHPFKPFPPHWNLPSPERFHVRNQEMIDYAKLHNGIVLAFWGGNKFRSGTLSTVNRAKRAGVPVTLFEC